MTRRRSTGKISWLLIITAMTFLLAVAGPAAAQEECPCLVGPDITNICHYGPSYPGCPATFPGGYCDPNGDGSFVDGDWDRGHREYIEICSTSGSGKPDVIVTRVWITPSNPEAGDHVQFHATVKNQGDAATPAGVITGVGFSVPGYYGWGIHSGQIQPGDSVDVLHDGDSQNRGYWAPPSGGTYTVTAKADDVNRYEESDEDNNARGLEFSVRGGPGAPDVVVTEVWITPANPQVGDQVQFHARVKNQGTAATPAGVITGVGFSVPGYYGWGVHSGQIQPNQSVEVHHTSDGDHRGRWTPTFADTYTLWAGADDINRYPESNEDNNWRSHTFRVGDGGGDLPDVVVSRVWITPAEPEAGDEVQFHAQVTNRGGAPTPSGVVTGVGFAAPGYYGWGVRSDPIAPGQTVTVHHTSDWQNRGRWIPDSPGSFTVWAGADDINRYPESNDRNNWRSLEVRVTDDGGGTGASKLGPHFLGTAWGTCPDRLVEHCPSVVKFMYGQGHDRLDELQQSCPNTQTVLRVYVPQTVNYTLDDERTARAEADDFWNRLWNDLQHLSAAEKSSLDWLEGPNEVDNLPDWYHNWDKAVNFAYFWDQLATHMHNNGFNPLVGSIAVGNPCMIGECPQSNRNYFQPVTDVIKAKHDQGWRIGWSYHGYSQFLVKNTDDEGEQSWTFRYRQTRAETGLEGIPIILTEGGQDTDRGRRDLIIGDSRCEGQWGWQCRGTSAQDYMDWLAWFDRQMQSESDVLGATLYQAAQSDDWWSFNICDQGLDVMLRDHMGGR